jgi:outer membrane biosynthesis protein TonB
LTQCPECSAQIIITDENCPSCNFPVSKLRGLCAATLTQNPDMIAALIQMGADVNSVDQNGRTPLMIASFIGDADIVEMLLAAGANPELTNDAGESALSLAQTKDVERLLRRAIVVLKFSAARKKEKEDTLAIEQDKVGEVPVEEVTPDIQEALTRLEPVVEPPRLTLETTQPMQNSSEEISVNPIPVVQSFDSSQVIIRSLDSTQPIPITFKELVSEEKEEPFTELEADIEEDPMSAEIDQFIQMELQDVQPPIVIESSKKYSSLTSDPMEESLKEFPDDQRVSEEIDEFIQSELQDIQPSNYFESSAEKSSLTMDPMEELLTEPPVASQEKVEEEFLQSDMDLEDVQPSIHFETRAEGPSVTLDPMEELLTEPPVASQEMVEEEFSQSVMDLEDVQPSIHFETRSEEPSVTFDSMDELLMELPVVSPEVKEDAFLEPELHATENFYQTTPANLQPESLDPTEPMLEEESKNREIEIPEEPEIPEPVIEEPAPVLNQSPPMQREHQTWEDWKQIEHAVAFAPWKIDAEPSDDESREEIELAQPIDEVIAPAPKTPEVPPKIFLNFSRVRNIAITIGVGIFLLQIFLFMNWPLGSKKTPSQTKVMQTPMKETRPVIPAPKPVAPKPQPKVEVQKEPVAPKPQPKVEVQKTPVAAPKHEPKRIAAKRPNPVEPSKKQAKIKYESKESEPAAVPSKAIGKSPQLSDEKLAKARDLNNQGSDLLRAGKVSEGISLLEQAVHTFPKDTHDENYASALLNLGRAWRMAGRPDISIRLLQQRMKINIERDEVERELLAAKRQAVESGMGIRND